MFARVLAALAFVLGASACGGGSGGGEGVKPTAGPCTATPAPASGVTLPRDFPMPDGVTVTSSVTSGPSQIIEGYASGEIRENYERFRAALGTNGYTVIKTEIEVVDAEVNFAGGDTTGQVRLGVACTGRTSVRITARPL